jgi:hypothetical protein
MVGAHGCEDLAMLRWLDPFNSRRGCLFVSVDAILDPSAAPSPFQTRNTIINGKKLFTLSPN